MAGLSQIFFHFMLELDRRKLIVNAPKVDSLSVLFAQFIKSQCLAFSLFAKWQSVGVLVAWRDLLNQCLQTLQTYKTLLFCLKSQNATPTHNHFV